MWMLKPFSIVNIVTSGPTPTDFDSVGGFSLVDTVSGVLLSERYVLRMTHASAFMKFSSVQPTSHSQYSPMAS